MAKVTRLADARTDQERANRWLATLEEEAATRGLCSFPELAATPSALEARMAAEGSAAILMASLP